MEYEINLMKFCRIIKKRRWLIFYVMLGCLLMAAVYGIFIVKPLYEADVSIIIGKEEARYFLEDRYTNSDVSLYLQVIKTYEEIANSRIVLSRTRDILNDEEFNNIRDIKVESKTNTQIITITVSHPSSQNVSLYANTLAEQFIQVAGEMLPAGELRILDKAEIPQNPSSPNMKLIMAASLLFSIMISVVIIYLLEYFNESVESEDDVMDYLNLPVLCVLPSMKLNIVERYVL